MRLFATAAFAFVMATPAMAQTITPTMPNDDPYVSGSNLIFTFATSGIPFGSGASIELHPQSTGTYTRFACVYDNVTYPGSNYVCTVNASSLPVAYKSTTVQYQTFVSAYGNPNSGTSNFSGFNYSYSTNSTGLPVELVAFSAAASGSSARLSWTTASETNNAGFYVEQQNGGAWNTVSGLIAGRGTTTERSDYAYAVNGLTAGVYTFRLRQVDTDGTVHYSPNATVEVGVDGAARLTLLGQRAVRIETNDASAMTLRVVDVLGRVVATRRVSVDGTVVVELPGLAAGAYVVRVDGDRFAATKTLVVR